jgi:hypothetical protein
MFLPFLDLIENIIIYKTFKKKIKVINTVKIIENLELVSN